MSLKREDEMTHAPDLLLLSQYDPELGEVAAFEELIGSHGGLGGPQTEPFILHPVEWTLDEEVPLGAPAIYRNIRRWLASIGIELGPQAAKATADAARRGGRGATEAGTGRRRVTGATSEVGSAPSRLTGPLSAVGRCSAGRGARQGRFGNVRWRSRRLERRDLLSVEDLKDGPPGRRHHSQERHDKEHPDDPGDLVAGRDGYQDDGWVQADDRAVDESGRRSCPG